MQAALTGGLLLSIGAVLAGDLPGDWPLPDPARQDHPAAAVEMADPRTYTYISDFQGRRARLLEALASNDLGTWRRGYFTGGDPGKYLPGPAMARLILDPGDAVARKYLNDDRSPREHYHFAAINWARFLPVFSGALTPETRSAVASHAARYSGYLQGGGTENHRTMNLFAAAVLPEYLEGGRLANRDRESALAAAKAALRTYVKTLYEAGPGEWDSPTYLMFTLHGLLNIYDFSGDPDMRLIAAAGLDWLTATYALKYRGGIFTGPNQRGYYDKPVRSIADQTGWLWWGSELEPENPGSFFYAIHPATSSWRPNRVLTRIAKKDLAGLPATQLNSHPNYWFGHQTAAKAGEYPETLHIGRSFTLGSLWRGFGSQITRLHLVADGPEGAVAITGGHPRKSDHKQIKLDSLTFRDGGGRYDQLAQWGPLVICLSRIPEDESADYTFVSIPDGVEPTKYGRRWVMRVGRAWVAVVPFTDNVAVAEIEPNRRELAAREKAVAAGQPVPKLPRMLKISGKPSGFALIAAEGEQFEEAAAFAEWTEEAYPIDTDDFANGLKVSGQAEGRPYSVVFNDDGDIARVTGIPVPPRAGAIYSGPFVRLENSVLDVWDGREGYSVDFSGDLPVYRNLEKPRQSEGMSGSDR